MSTREIDPRFGLGLRRVRVARGWSQRELARRTSVSYMFVQFTENARSSPRIDYALRVATTLGTTIDKIIERGMP